MTSQRTLLSQSIILFVVLEISLVMIFFFFICNKMEYPGNLISSIIIPLPVSVVFSLILYFYRKSREELDENENKNHEEREKQPLKDENLPLKGGFRNPYIV